MSKQAKPPKHPYISQVGIANVKTYDSYWCVYEEFKHLSEFEKLISSIDTVAKSKNEIEVEALLERCRFIVDEYQEQPHLLDPHLEKVLADLLAYVKDESSDIEVKHLAFKVIYLITKTRGYKIIVRLMPHEVADMEPVLALLSHETTALLKNWESRYILLLWLSIVCMIPFDMVKLDNINAKGDDRREPIMDRIIDTGKRYLDESDKSRDAAAYMLSKFMTRPDVKASKLAEFLDWTMQVLHQSDLSSMKTQRKVFGVMSTLALLFKHGKREDLLPHAPIILGKITSLKLEETKNTSLRKLGMKMIQRIALAFLRVRVASWRYQRGSRSLKDNLNQEKPTISTTTTAAGEEEEEDYEIPDEMEDVIEQLLIGLRDDNTVVRWSAAKGIGRITGRLPKELADEVVGSIMELFTHTETDMAWHGGCLALAELGRRGLLLPQRLHDVVPVIVKALNFDEKRGHFSVGAHVRDAACYVCWAFARAYEPVDMKPYVDDIARALVIVFIYDREGNVRRAASAAFQENVGRQGQFPHGIDILTTCDYFTVGNITNCYLDHSEFVGGFHEYTQSLMDHLTHVKSAHWDEAVRDLAAQALSKLTYKDPDYLIKTLLPGILTETLSVDLTARHGAVLLTAWVIHALSHIARDRHTTLTDMIGADCLNHLTTLVQKYYDARFFLGSGGELMRRAVCVLIEKISLSQLPLHDDTVITVWQKFIDEGLEYNDPVIQKAAAAAIPAFFTQYYQVEGGQVKDEVHSTILPAYIHGLKHSMEYIRMGYAQALGALPQFIIQGYFSETCSALIAASSVDVKEVQFAESRRDCVNAITSLCSTLSFKGGLKAGDLPVIYGAYFKAMEDYTLDSRGDVGSWVREASMTGLKTLTTMIVNEDPALLQPDWCSQVFLCLIQQACEKIDRTRALAGETLIDLLYHEPQIPHVPERAALETILSREKVKDVNWSVPAVTFPLFIQCLNLPVYAYHVMLGFTVSSGGLTESLVRHSSASLINYISENITDVKSCEQFASLLIKICHDFARRERVIVPMMKMLDQLLACGAFTVLAETDDPEFAVSLLAMIKREIIKCGDPQKLLACIDVCCGMLQFTGDVRRKTMSQLLIFMCYRYPIVRKNAANKFYENILMYDDLLEQEKLEEVMNILSDTVWDKPVDEIRPIRNQLCEILGVPVPTKAKAPTK